MTITHKARYVIASEKHTPVRDRRRVPSTLAALESSKKARVFQVMPHDHSARKGPKIDPRVAYMANSNDRAAGP